MVGTEDHLYRLEDRRARLEDHLDRLVDPQDLMGYRMDTRGTQRVAAAHLAVVMEVRLMVFRRQHPQLWECRC